MRLIGLAVVLILSMLASDAAEGQRRHVPRLGVLGIGGPMNPGHVAFLDELRALGYLEGRTITIESRWAEERQDRLPTLAAELSRSRWTSW